MKRQDLLSLSFYEHSPFTGSIGKLRYKIEKSEDQGNKTLTATIWHGEFAFDHTSDSEKTSKIFEFSEEGMENIAAWINGLLN